MYTFKMPNYFFQSNTNYGAIKHLVTSLILNLNLAGSEYDLFILDYIKIWPSELELPTWQSPIPCPLNTNSPGHCHPSTRYLICLLISIFTLLGSVCLNHITIILSRVYFGHRQKHPFILVAVFLLLIPSFFISS